jgi:hypothetical protein
MTASVKVSDPARVEVEDRRVHLEHRREMRRQSIQARPACERQHREVLEPSRHAARRRGAIAQPLCHLGGHVEDERGVARGEVVERHAIEAQQQAVADRAHAGGRHR